MNRGTAVAALLISVLALSCSDSPANPDATGENQGPTARVTNPEDGSAFTRGDPVPFEATADDPEDGSLDGSSLDWSSSIDGRFGIGRSLQALFLSPGEHRVTLTATDSDGATAEDEVTVVVSENRSPTVTIAEPADGAVYTEGDVIRFEGSAVDAEDGPITGASLVWASHTDGELGTGESVEFSQLSVSQHRILLYTVDSHGACGWADIILHVEPSSAVTFGADPDDDVRPATSTARSARSAAPDGCP